MQRILLELKSRKGVFRWDFKKTSNEKSLKIKKEDSKTLFSGEDVERKTSEIHKKSNEKNFFKKGPPTKTHFFKDVLSFMYVYNWTIKIY